MPDTNLLIRSGRFLYRKLGLNIQNYNSTDAPLAGSILDSEASNKLLYGLIQSGKPAMVSRFGTPESRTLLNYLQISKVKDATGLKKLHTLFKGNINYWYDEVRKDISVLAGFFPNTDEQLERYADFNIEKIKNIDAIGVWGFVPGENFLINSFCPAAIKFDPRGLEPYFFQQPWSKALEGKKVLVIHPFEKSINHQYKIRERIFKYGDVLPEFELTTIKAVQSIANTKTPHNDWFEALHFMQRQIDDTDFDVALIGAGSYGLPLSAYVKEKGKIAIHIGGALQILFGIKGKRWDADPIISSFYNEHWIRPLVEETVTDAVKVEGGCYW